MTAPRPHGVRSSLSVAIEALNGPRTSVRHPATLGPFEPEGIEGSSHVLASDRGSHWSALTRRGGQAHVLGCGRALFAA